MLPTNTDAKTATDTSFAFVNLLRTMKGDSRGITLALETMLEELEFLKNAAAQDVARLEEKRDLEIEALKPVVEKNVKKIIQKQYKALSRLQKSFDKNTTALENRREKFMRKIQLIEQRKDAVQKRVSAAKRKKNASKS